MINVTKSSWCLGILALLLACTPAAGQDGAPLETVENRYRPALDPAGIRLGGFRLSPSIGMEAHFTDNIFADPSISDEDFIYILNPGASLESDWSVHSLYLEAEAEIGRYDDNDSEDFDDFSLAAEGRLDISRSSYLGADLAFQRTHEERTSAENARNADLTVYDMNRARVSFMRRPNRLYVRLDASIADIDFEDARAGNRIINNDDRNRQESTQSLDIGYEFKPGDTVYLRGAARSLDYEQEIDDDGFARSGDGYEVVLGASRSISGLSAISVYAGYFLQNFDDIRFDDFEGVSFGADLTWNVSNLITLNAAAARTIEPTSIFGASGVVAEYFELGLDYELLRSLIVSADFEIGKDVYEGIDRKDDVVGAGLGIKFMLNRNIYLYFGYDYSDREVEPRDFADDIYTINAAFMRVQGQL
ncbi:MAG: outer membrane beta-barrel protein [Woeseia sp.]|nr:outer membrane beta-barrel protein [Gammaproteobacteria bacterium]NNE59958.1 outer membrane beta-barrel protein [Woeseia sp.]NNL52283.1 outer membrane beta-barrel protein [Woeseiaceae bacterium]